MLVSRAIRRLLCFNGISVDGLFPISFSFVLSLEPTRMLVCAELSDKLLKEED